PGGDGLLATSRVDGVALSRLPVEDITEELLDDVWSQVGSLHRQGIAHRWITAEHLLISVDDAAITEDRRELGAEEAGPALRATVINFRWAVQQAEDRLLAADNAAAVVALASVVGAERAVASARRNLSREDIARALPFVQPLALPHETRGAIDGN